MNRCDHQLARSDNGWTCSVCAWSWKGRPDTGCPGRHRYTWQTAAAAELATRTQLGRQGLKLAPGQEPAGCVLAGDGRRYYDVYAVASALPKEQATAAQLEALARGREKALAGRTCADCSTVFRPDDARYSLDENGRCDDCAEAHWRAEEGARARSELAALATAGDWLILDTETTGLDEEAEIVQLALVDPAGHVVFDQLVRPSQPIPRAATAVHGIGESDVAGAPAFPEIYQDLAQLVDGRRLLAYNVAFDGRMLAQTCARYGLPELQPSGWACVMELFAAYWGDWSSHHGSFRWQSLSAACAIAEVDTAGLDLHSAAGDALLAWRLVKGFEEHVGEDEIQ